MPLVYSELTRDAEILRDRAAELGILTYDEAYVIASTKGRLTAEDGLTPEEEANLTNVISTLLQKLAPENLDSIVRRQRSSYKFFLGFLGVVLVCVAVLTLIAIIPLTSLFSSLKATVLSAEQAQSENIVQTIVDFHRIRDDLLPGLEEAQTAAGADQNFNRRELEEAAAELAAKYETIGSTLSSDLRAVCEVEARYLPPGATLFDIVLRGFSVSASGNESTCEQFDSIPPEEAMRVLLRKQKSVTPVMNLLGGTLLPLLYGFLGAAIYVIRNIANTPIGLINLGESIVGIPLRLGLGAVAGLALGWFNITDEVSQLTTTPFALAFVAGFSIDILFSFLERVVNAFAVAPAAEQSARPPQAGGRIVTTGVTRAVTPLPQPTTAANAAT